MSTSRTSPERRVGFPEQFNATGYLCLRARESRHGALVLFPAGSGVSESLRGSSEWFPALQRDGVEVPGVPEGNTNLMGPFEGHRMTVRKPTVGEHQHR